ncbi:MAG: type II secretion system F family protein [Chloroflexi bacterium]|nr:type II secretion system F family protein [Chloroflexota bacterium]
MILLVPILVFASVVFCVSAVVSLRAQPALRGRLQQYVGGDEVSLYDTDLAKPLLDKLVWPLFQRTGALVGRMTPDNVTADIEKRLRQADYPLGMNVNTFVLAKATLMIGLPVAYGLPLWLGSRGSISLFQAGVIAGLFFVGLRAPDWWLDHRVSVRKRQINRSLPDALDLIVICSEAGLALEGAMARVVERLKGPLADEIRRTLGEISLGKRRRDALRALADRTEAHDLVAFVAAVVQADQTGISIGNVLHVQAEDLRLRRRQRAEKEGRQAPLKMLFPNIFFIFPATFIVLVGPAALRIADQMLTGQ